MTGKVRVQGDAVSTWTGANLAAVLFPTAETLRQVRPLALTSPASEASTAWLAHPLHSLITNTVGKLQGQRVHMCLACVSDMCSSLSAAAERCASGAFAGAERSAMLRCGRLPRRGRRAWCCW